MEKIVQFLKDCGTFYLATAEGDQPRVRPFGAVTVIDGKLYLCTNNKKPCFAQILQNPKVEVCGTAPSGTAWLRLCGTVALDSRVEAREAFLTQFPLPMYKADDGIFEVFYFTQGEAILSTFGGQPETIAF